MVFCKLKQLVVAEQINAGIAHMHILRKAAAHQRAYNSGAHAAERRRAPRLFINAAVGLLHGAFQQCASGLRGVRLVNTRLDGLLQRIHRHGAGQTAAARTAHTVAHGAPNSVVRAASPPVAVLVFAALAADICFSDKLHAVVPPFASRRSWPQAALMSVPRRRRTVALTPSSVRSV